MACFGTDVLCPNCGGNLDELFEQLPDSEVSDSVPQVIAKHFSLLNWLAPLLFILSPIVVSLVIAIPFALRVTTTADRSPLDLIWHVVPSSTLIPLILLTVYVLPLFLCSTSWARERLGLRVIVMIAVLFSILSVVALWHGLQIANFMSIELSFAYFAGHVFLGWADWVNIAAACGVVLLILNLLALIGRAKPPNTA